MDPGIKLQKDMQSASFDPQLYRSLVGSLIYLTNTRLDICYAVSCLSRYMDLPQETHWTAAKQILRYLKGTIDFAFQFAAEEVTYLHSYADADWGKEMDTCRSTSGILHQIGNSLIDWSSKLQPTVSLSTTEAEYRVLTDVSKVVVHLRRLLHELGVDTTEPTRILSNNKSCIKLVYNPVSHA